MKSSEKFTLGKAHIAAIRVADPRAKSSASHQDTLQFNHSKISNNLKLEFYKASNNVEI